MQTTPVILESNDKNNDQDSLKNKPELVISTTTTTKEPILTKHNYENNALDDVDKRTEETEDEIKIIEEVNIESSHVNLRDMIKDRSKIEIDVKKRIRSMNDNGNNKIKNQRVEDKDPMIEETSTTTSKNDSIKNETVKITKAGHKIKLIREDEIQDNQFEMENTLKPMPKYVMTRRVGGATYPTGNAWEWVQRVMPPIVINGNEDITSKEGFVLLASMQFIFKNVHLISWQKKERDDFISTSFSHFFWTVLMKKFKPETHKIH